MALYILTIKTVRVGWKKVNYSSFLVLAVHYFFIFATFQYFTGNIYILESVFALSLTENVEVFIVTWTIRITLILV